MERVASLILNLRNGTEDESATNVEHRGAHGDVIFLPFFFPFVFICISPFFFVLISCFIKSQYLQAYFFTPNQSGLRRSCGAT